MLSVIRRIKKQRIHLFLLLSLFVVSVVSGAVYSRCFEVHLPLDAVREHFSPEYTLNGALKYILSSFYNDAFEVLYIFVAGFMIWGKPIAFSLVAVRGIRLGYYFSSLICYYLLDASLLSILELTLFCLANIFVAVLILQFSYKAIEFNDTARELMRKQHRLVIVKTQVFAAFLTDTVIICGIITVIKSIYSLLIILL